jgi:tight adherence protein C
VDIGGLRAFAPASGLDLHPANANFAGLVGQRLEFKVVQFEKAGRDVVVSRRPMLEKEAHERRKQALAFDALKNLSRRLGVDEVNAFVTLLVQSEALGTSIADSLRVYAQEMRTSRLMRAEEMANKLPVKITVPLGFAIMPCLILVIMTPAAIRVIRTLFPVFGG